MKKSFKTIAAFTMAAFMTTSYTACSDELESEQTTYDMSAKASRQLYPLGCGYQTIVGTASEIAGMRIPVESDQIRIESSNSDIQYQILRDKQGFYLSISTEATNGATDHIVLSNAEGRTKELDIYVQAESGCGTRATVDGIAADARARAAQFLGYTFNIRNSKIATGRNALRISPDSIDTPNLGYKVSFQKHEGSTMNEITREVSREFGASIPIPVDGVAVTFGITAKCSEKTVTRNNYEYLVASRRVLASEGVITMASLQYPERCIGLLNPTLNDALNNPQSAEYQKYVGRDGLCRLLDTYGTHIVTECQLGATTQSIFSKKKDFTGLTTEESLGLSLSTEILGAPKDGEKEKAEEKQQKDKSIWEKNMERGMATPKSSFTAQFSDKLSDICESMEASTEEYIRGGKGTTVSSWSFDYEDATQWDLIAFGTENTLENQKLHNGVNESLIPLYRFCMDPDRAMELKSLIEPDEDGRIAYVQYQEMQKPQIILADVVLDTIPGKSSASDAQPRVMKDPFGVSRMYFPMIQNPNFGYSDSNNGRPLNFNDWHFRAKSSEYDGELKRSLVCYYALDYDDGHNGVLSVRLGDEDSQKQADEYKRGVYTYQMFSSSTIDTEKHTHVLVKYADRDTRPEDKITGIGWFYNDKSKDEDNVFTSTAGTDWEADPTFSASAKQDFRKYFGEGNFSWGNNARFAQFKEWHWYLFGAKYDIEVDRQISIGYTKKPIERDLNEMFKEKNRKF